MNQLTRNRLIGGSVLLLASMLFVPAILTPEDKALTNPDLAIAIQSNSPKATPKNTEIPPAPALALESIGSPDKPSAQLAKAEKKPAKTSQQPKPMTISLESTSDIEPKKPAVKSVTAKATQKVSWLRVGSFSSMANAQNLADTLKKNQFPVKIETTAVGEKTFRRVLVGPFTNEKQLKVAMQRISEGGYEPRIQR